MLHPFMLYHTLILHPCHRHRALLDFMFTLASQAKPRGAPERPPYAIVQRATPFLSFPILSYPFSLLPLLHLDEEKYIFILDAE